MNEQDQSPVLLKHQAGAAKLSPAPCGPEFRPDKVLFYSKKPCIQQAEPQGPQAGYSKA